MTVQMMVSMPKSAAVMILTAFVTHPVCLSNGLRYYLRRCRYATNVEADLDTQAWLLYTRTCTSARGVNNYFDWSSLDTQKG